MANDGTGKLPKFVEEMQRRRVEVEDILFIVRAMVTRNEEGGTVDWYSAVNILGERYKGDPGKVSCIMKRVECLIPLTEDSRMGGWSVEDFGTEYVITNVAVFRAVAKCPLRATPRRMWFDPDEFFSLALMEAKPEGRA